MPDTPLADEELQGYDEVDAFCESLIVERGYSEHTVRNYRIDLLDFLRWAQRSGYDPFRLTHKQMRRYLGELDQARYARTTVNRRLSSLRTFFRWMCALGYLDTDPASIISGPKTNRTLPKTLQPNDMVRLLSVHREGTGGQDGAPRQTPEDVRDEALLEFLYACGARVSEASGLKYADVDFSQRLVKVFGKGSKERIIPIHDLAIDAMRTYARDARPLLLGDKSSDLFFVSSRGSRYTTDAIRKMFKTTCRAAGVDESLSPHAMRHTFATDMLTGGADLRSVQEMLGHASLSTTQIYTHISPERLRAIHAQAHPRG